MMQYIMCFANNPVFRYLLGWSMPPKFSLLKLMRQNILPKEQNLRYVLQVSFLINRFEIANHKLTKILNKTT